MTLTEFLGYAKKAALAFGAIEGAAVGLGLLDNAAAGWASAALGAVTTALVYFADNVPPKKAAPVVASQSFVTIPGSTPPPTVAT